MTRMMGRANSRVCRCCDDGLDPHFARAAEKRDADREIRAQIEDAGPLSTPSPYEAP